MKKWLLLALAGLTLLTACQKNGDSATSQPDNNAHFPQLTTEVADNEALVQLNTSMGAIKIKLFPEETPLTVENFMTHAKEGYYNGLTFHRVIQGFMIQGGDPNGDGTGGTSIWNGKDATIDSGSGFADEFSPYLYNLRGALSMANSGSHTNGSQFFINQGKEAPSTPLTTDVYPTKIIEAYNKGGNAYLDGRHTVFGQVISGMNVVDAIAAVSKDENDKPRNPVTINSIDILKDYDFAEK